MKSALIITSLFAGFIIISCHTEAPPSSIPDVFADKVDSSANPADDFFQWANGKWIKNNPIPSSETHWGIGDLVQEEIYSNLRKISDDASKANAAEGTDTKKIGDFWATAMDSVKADKAGLDPLKSQLAEINSIKTVDDAVRVSTDLDPFGADIFYSGFYVMQDARNSEQMSITLEQGGLGLHERDYYFSGDSDDVKIRAAYVTHMRKMLELVGVPAPSPDNVMNYVPDAPQDPHMAITTHSAQKKTPAMQQPADYKTSDKLAIGIMNFETALAGNSRKLEDTRDPYENYNKMSMADFTKKYTPSFDWSAIAKAHGLQNADSVVVGQPEFFSSMDKVLHATNIEVIKNYMIYHLVTAYAPYLSSSVTEENFDFYGKTMRGAKEQRPRWKRALDSEEDAMGMVLGKLFAAAYFPEKAKKRYSDLVEAIRTAYGERIRKLTWMSDSTKAKALDKLKRITKKVGYPDKWKDYSKLVVGTDSWCANMMYADEWEFNDMLSKYGKPVDRTEWDMTPQTYNAYYNPSNNEIVLPAAIFTVPGYPDSLLDDAVVYGYAAASTIGHEITHGFDDEGRNYDANGNLVNWWTAGDSASFVSRAAMMVHQFDAYEPLPGKNINGKATLGENIADYGGLLLGIDAFKKTDQYKKGEKIGGYTPMQRYFMGYALGWLYSYRPESVAQQLMLDVHSPAKFRVNGPFSDIPDFYDAFGVKQGDKMWRPDSLRVSIW